MGTLEFIFASNEALSANYDSNGVCSNMLPDDTNNSPLDDQFPGFDVDDLFDLTSPIQNNGSNIPDHEYCLQEDNITTFEQNFDLSGIDPNYFSILDSTANNVLPNLQVDLKDVDFLNEFTFESTSPSTSEESMQTFQSFPQNPGLDALSVLPVIQREIPNRTQCVVLSEDEQALLSKEGFELPVNVPLTREEERILKVVRRKIRNKMSAKVSRMKKQNYVDGLEQRIKICTQQNRDLQVKVEKLQKQNLTLALQLKKLQDVLFKPRVTIIARKRQIQAGGCLMVLLLSFALFILPSMAPWLEDYNSKFIADQPASLSTGRKILQDSNLVRSDHMEEYAPSPHTLLDGHSTWYEDPPGDPGRVRPTPEQFVLVLEDRNYNLTSVKSYDRNDL